MTDRPIYVGTGECECGRVDVQLYHVPGTTVLTHAVCAVCLEARGFEVPKPRTAADLEVVDGKPQWRESQPTVPYPKTTDAHVGKLDLEHGHIFESVVDGEGMLAGWLHTHPDARGNVEPCQSFCAVRAIDQHPVHQVVCADPLTLTPSLKCRTCGAHGHITNGRWEPC